MRYSPDNQRVYFDITRVHWSCKNTIPTDRMRILIFREHVRKLPRRSKKQWLRDGSGIYMDLCATSPGGNLDIFGTWYRVRLADGPDATLANTSEGRRSVGFDFEKMVMSFDWQDVVSRTFLKKQR